MKGILKKTPDDDDVKRKLSFAPDVIDVLNEPPRLLPGFANVPGPIPLPGRVPGPSTGRPRMQLVVSSDDDYFGGLMDDEGWSAPLVPLLVCAGLIVCLAVVGIAMGYTSGGSSDISLSPSPMSSGNAVNASNDTCAPVTASLATLGTAIETAGRRRDDQDDGSGKREDDAEEHTDWSIAYSHNGVNTSDVPKGYSDIFTTQTYDLATHVDAPSDQATRRGVQRGYRANHVGYPSSTPERNVTNRHADKKRATAAERPPPEALTSAALSTSS